MCFSSSKKGFVVCLIVLLFSAASVSQVTALHSEKLRWLVGKIFVISDGSYDFQSTGFIFKSRLSHYVITAYHVIENIQRRHGEGAQIFIQLPTIEKALPLRPVFTEPLEDTAVFEIIDSFPGYVPDSDYESPLLTQKGRRLKIIGYLTDISRQHEPRVHLGPPRLRGGDELLREFADGRVGEDLVVDDGR